MKLVADTNRIVAALIAGGASRKILMNPQHEFMAPDFSKEELEKHSDEILKKSGIDMATFDVLISWLYENIETVPMRQYKNALKEAERLIGGRDKKDAPFLALAIAHKADGIWSDDKDFEAQKKVRIFKTKELLA